MIDEPDDGRNECVPLEPLPQVRAWYYDRSYEIIFQLETLFFCYSALKT